MPDLLQPFSMKANSCHSSYIIYLSYKGDSHIRARVTPSMCERSQCMPLWFLILP